jgi:hypothetical protein
VCGPAQVLGGSGLKRLQQAGGARTHGPGGERSGLGEPEAGGVQVGTGRVGAEAQEPEWILEQAHVKWSSARLRR